MVSTIPGSKLKTHLEDGNPDLVVHAEIKETADADGGGLVARCAKGAPLLP